MMFSYSSPGELEVTNPISPRSPNTFILMDPPRGHRRSPSPSSVSGVEDAGQYERYYKEPTQPPNPQPTQGMYFACYT